MANSRASVSRTPVGEAAGEEVQVYWNSHKRCWSIRQRGRVTDRAVQLILENVRFRVSAAGRSRCLQRNQKTVHAFAIGRVVVRDHRIGDEYLAELSAADITVFEEHGHDVRYNPFVAGYFYDATADEKIERAWRVLLTAGGRVKALVEDTHAGSN